jgi:glycosyltransferase involved in cell wall biosynthesis
MIEFVFTIDYEIYGNGIGSLDELVYKPARRLKSIFENYDARFVAFVEVAELEKIEAFGTDQAISLVKQQVKEFYRDGFEIGLHLHPQWSNAHYHDGRWCLDLDEYNLCTLPRTRIAEIVDGSLAYLRHMVGQSDFTPLSFRAGNWLFQPTQTAASVLSEKGIKIDSSVFKGGLQRNHRMDYRVALKNGYYWPFSHDVNKLDPTGPLIEVPIHAELVPPWRMWTTKRMALGNQYGTTAQSSRQKLTRIFDFLRIRYPLKLDFSRMSLDEMISMIDKVIREDRERPESYRPVVAIGHTKDRTDPDAVGSLLSFLQTRRITVSTFTDIYPRLASLTSQNDSGMPSCRESALNSQVQKATASCVEGNFMSENSARVFQALPAPGKKSKPVAQELRLVLVTPARNEAAFIEETIKSVVDQIVQPVRWVIVSDGSTDGTDEIVAAYAATHDWIKLVRLPERQERNFAGKVNAFNAGYATLSGLDYNVIGNLDADISVDKGHFEFLLEKLSENPKLGVAGTPFREGRRQYDYRFTSIEHVSGACQLFRRECFEQIGGYKPIKTGGIDLVAVISARMKGWQTRSFVEKASTHHRKMGTAKHNALVAIFHGGFTDYTHGSDPVWEVFRCMYQMTRWPIVLSGSFCLAGFLWAMVSRTDRVVSPEFIQFRRIEQRRRLRNFFKQFPSGLSHKPQPHL